MKNTTLAIALLLSTLTVGCGASGMSHSRTSSSIDYQSPSTDIRTGNMVGFNHHEQPCSSVPGYRNAGIDQNGVHWYCF